MNIDSFDMDGSLSTPEPNNRNNKKTKNNNRIILFVFVILVILCVIAGYFYIVSVKKTINSENNTQLVANENIVDADEDVLVNDLTSDNPSTSISQTNVSSIIKEPDTTTLALDISKVKSDKAKKGAVQFTNHIVQNNETLNSIAALYSLKVQTLISVNEIKNIDGVVEGIQLQIPDRNGRFYVVKSGDMLSTIANNYAPNLGWKTLQDLNGLTDTKLDIGDKIFIPDMSEVNANPAITKALTQFVLPSSKGTIVAKYGQFIENNIYNDDVSLNGILIKTDSSIIASSKGVVVDIQNKNGKKVVKLSHEGGYETVYGNLEDTELSIGNQVESNKEVGIVSKDDNILYFEIVQGGIALDPESFF